MFTSNWHYNKMYNTVWSGQIESYVNNELNRYFTGGTNGSVDTS